MHARNIRHIIIQRFSEKAALEHSTRPLLMANDPRRPVRLRQFFKMAEHRKRQMLEKMLMD